MLEITKASSNTIRVSLAEKQTLTSPTFLFEFINDASEVGVTCIAADTSSYPARYNEFVITEQASPTALNGEVELLPAGEFTYNIYEQSSATNLFVANATTLLETGKVRVVGNFDRQATNFTTYDNPTDTQVFWDQNAAEGVVVTPPTTDVTYENSDQSFTATIPKGTTYVAADITWTDSDLSSNTAPANTNITCTPAAAGSGIRYQQVNSSYRTQFALYDESWRRTNGDFDSDNSDPATIAELDYDNSFPFHFLKENNAFGNLARFTDANGDYYTNPSDSGSATDPGAFSDNYVIDHLYNRGWLNVEQTASSWSAALVTANAATNLTFSDWKLPIITELESIACDDPFGLSATKFGLAYYPFNNTNNALLAWSGTTSAINNSYRMIYYQGASNATYTINRDIATDLNPFFLVRKHYT